MGFPLFYAERPTERSELCSKAVTELRGTTALARQHPPLDREPGEPLQTVRYGDGCAVNIESYRHSMDA
jgi:hypothetical protein